MKYKTFSHDYGGALKLYYYLTGKNIKSCDYNLTGPSYKLLKDTKAHLISYIFQMTKLIG